MSLDIDQEECQMLKTNTAPAALLSDVVSGRVAGPGDPDWDDARQPFAVVFPADEEDVAAVVSFARLQGLQVASHSAAHDGGPLRATVLVDTTGLG
jgi:FAD/FMN-containing dehydrogenase